VCKPLGVTAPARSFRNRPKLIIGCPGISKSLLAPKTAAPAGCARRQATIYRAAEAFEQSANWKRL
jgi:hypothetical protein